MFLEMVKPIVQQMNDMKLVNENNKQFGRDLMEKFEDIKRLLITQTYQP